MIHCAKNCIIQFIQIIPIIPIIQIAVIMDIFATKDLDHELEGLICPIRKTLNTLRVAVPTFNVMPLNR